MRANRRVTDIRIEGRGLYLIVVLLFLQCDKVDENRTIEIKGTKITVEMAVTSLERSKGLSHRDSLARDHGMFFVFPDEDRRVFWMYGCRFSIDLAFIDGFGTIREIVTMEKEPVNRPIDSLKLYPSKSSGIKFALEMPAGWFEEHKIQAGDQIKYLP